MPGELGCPAKRHLPSNLFPTSTHLQLVEKQMRKDVFSSEQAAKVNKQRQRLEKSSLSQFLQSMKNYPRKIENHKTPEGQKLTNYCADLLQFNGKFGVFCLSWNGFV